MKWDKGVAVGAATWPPFTRDQLKAYAAASGDLNKIHLDDSFAKEGGFPSVIVHGMLSMSYLADFVRKNFPESEFELLRFKSRFRKVTFPGDSLTMGGEIKSTNDNRFLTLYVWAKNQDGEVKIDGEADVRPKAGA